MAIPDPGSIQEVESSSHVMFTRAEPNNLRFHSEISDYPPYLQPMAAALLSGPYAVPLTISASVPMRLVTEAVNSFRVSTKEITSSFLC